jgi:hypothetical protein
MIPNVTVPEGSAGKWSIERFIVEGNSIEAMRLAWSGRHIEPGTYTRLVHMHRGCVMSDTPAEKKDHFDFVINAKGHVLINGLGIGMCLAAALAKPDVTAATVVEIDSDVIELVGSHYLKDSRVEIINSSAFNYEPPKGIRYGAVWHDIWDAMCSDNLPEMQALHRKYGRRADWQGSWGRWECEQQKRSERRWA